MSEEATQRKGDAFFVAMPASVPFAIRVFARQARLFLMLLEPTRKQHEEEIELVAEESIC
jgi:hypothetical protein